ncbi:MAG: glycoside hydrolase family 13 protein [Trueperaceae bacterium]
MDIPDWVPDAVFYQIFPERFYNGNTENDPKGVERWDGKPTRENFFGGDLDGIIQKLDYIAELGFNALYLNPIFKAGTNHKYDTHDYFTIDPTFGDDQTFDRLIEEAHLRGVRIVLDGVFNHCGTGFEPFRDVVEHGSSSRYWDWFDIYDYPLKTEPDPNYATCGGAPYLPRLNTRNPGVEAFVHEVALHWLARGIDGWRLDVPYEIHTDFWRRFRRVVKDNYPDAYLVAEEWRDPSTFLQGDTFDGATHYPLRGLAFDFLVKNALTGEAFARALETLRRQMPKDSQYGMMTLLGGHDTPRLLTECDGNIQAAILLYTFLLTMPGAPMIYYGDENGMHGDNDPDCRRPMVWDEQNWQPNIRKAITQLVKLRSQHILLRRGTVDTAYANDRVYAYYRRLERERALVILNNTAMSRTLSIPVDFPDNTALHNALCQEQVVTVRDGFIELNQLMPRSPVLLMPRS